jgi:hypothetical protein
MPSDPVAGGLPAVIAEILTEVSGIAPASGTLAGCPRLRRRSTDSVAVAS